MYVIAANLTILIAALLPYSMSLIGENDILNQPSPYEVTAPQQELLHVILAPKQRTVLSAQISTPLLSSQVSATIKKIYKRMGETFEKGETLIEIDNFVYGANVDSAVAARDRAKTVLAAKEKLFKDRIASYVDIKEAQALVAKSEAELALAQNQYESATIVAPYRGRVENLAIEEYELPQPGQALIAIVEDDVLLAKVLVPSSLWNRLAIGKQFTVNVMETGTTVVAKIIRIGAVVDPSSSTIAIDAEINNDDRTLLAGMTGTTQLEPPESAKKPQKLPEQLPPKTQNVQSPK